MFRDYPAYKKTFAPDVKDSKLLSHSGDQWAPELHFGRTVGLTTVNYDAEYLIQYKRLSDSSWQIFSRSTRISELDDKGNPLSNGASQGFLWNLNSYWLISEKKDGLYLECRAISLSRDIPTGLGWVVRPIISNLPRESLKATLEQARNALK